MPQSNQRSLALYNLDGPESNNTEYKNASEGRLPADLWQVVSAFSNTDGGKIYLGVDTSGEPIGLSNDELDKIQLDIASLCDSVFNITIVPDIEVTDRYVAVHIHPAPAQVRPIYKKSVGMNKGAYIRVGSSCRLASEDIIKRFTIAGRGGAETLEYLGKNYSTCLDVTKIENYIANINKSRNDMYQKFSLEEILVKQKITNCNGDVTFFGLLAFGKDAAVQEIIAPSVNIAVTQYSGSNKVNDDDLNETFLDNREFNGSAVGQFLDTFAFIKTKLPIMGTVGTAGQRRDYLVIPEIAIREALANSIVHRDYSSQSSRIQIDIYSNRLEIINPGTSLVPIEELESAPSTTRNPLLMNYLKESGVTEQKARGIRTIKISIRKAGLLEPTFANISQSFKITLYGSAFISSRDHDWLTEFAIHNLNDRQLNALVHTRNNLSGISNSEYRDINNMTNVRDDKRANKELRILVDLNILQIEGENKARRYVLSGEFM